MSSLISAFNRTRGTRIAENVRIADTHWSRLRGLIGVSHLAFDSGQALWIVPCRGVHTLAMAFPLDLIYLDREGNVVDVQEDVAPWRFAPVRFRATSVLELPAGSIHSSGTMPGDRIEIVTARSPEGLAA